MKVTEGYDTEAFSDRFGLAAFFGVDAPPVDPATPFLIGHIGKSLLVHEQRIALSAFHENGLFCKKLMHRLFNHRGQLSSVQSKAKAEGDGYENRSKPSRGSLW